VKQERKNDQRIFNGKLVYNPYKTIDRKEKKKSAFSEANWADGGEPSGDHQVCPTRVPPLIYTKKKRKTS